MVPSRRLSPWWLVWSWLALVPAGCDEPGIEYECRNGAGTPGLDVYLGPAFHGGKVTTRGACTQVEFVQQDDRDHEVWRGRLTSTEGSCTVTVVTPDGKTYEQTVANKERCGGPEYQRVYFGPQ